MNTNKTIYALVDYKAQFGSKTNASIYRSGMDMDLLKKYIQEYSYDLQTMHFSDVDLSDVRWKDRLVIYTSQEDPGYVYKDYIEDVVYGLELLGAKICPTYRFLRANNNKVFMEMLRDISLDPSLLAVKSRHYGSLPEYLNNKKDRIFPLIFKTPQGAKSKGVFKAESENEAYSIIAKMSKTRLTKLELRDLIRAMRHKGYVRNSRYRTKFITQNYINGLKNDWKILVFGDKFFLEYRGVRDNDFRASGSQKFLFDDTIYNEIPQGIFQFAEHVRDTFNMPHWSLDIGYKDGTFYLFEFQALYFSSYAQEHSMTYFQRQQDEFVRKSGEFTLEQLYAESFVKWIEKNVNN